MTAIGKFQIIGLIGSGAYGQVFRVRDTLLDIERAIKIVHVSNPTEFKNAIDEAQILEKCRHQNTVDIKEVDIFSNAGNPVPCIVMEYLKNGSVQSLLEKQFISPKYAAKIIGEVLFGLEHAHNSGVWHRDIKPGNILLANNGQAKLSDFGLAYGLSHQAFMFVGYNSHLPPEVLKNATQDSISDLYALGVTLYRLVNNLATLPLPFSDDAKWLKALEKERFPKRDYSLHVPESIRRIINKSIRADRNNRYQTCSEFRQAIQRISFAIEWKPISPTLWKGVLGSDEYEQVLYSKRSGYFIDFKKNNRLVREKSLLRIDTLANAEMAFFNTIRVTTLSV